MFTHLLLPKKHVSKLPRFTVALVLMLMLLGVAGSSQAQVYYLTNDATSGSSSSTDGIFRMGYDGSSATALGSSFTNSPALLQVDVPNNRAFVYEAFSSSPPTNLAIKVVNLTTGALITNIPLALTGRIQSIKYDPINDYIYYVVQDSAPTSASTTNDALIRVKPDGTGSTTLITGFCTNPSFLALDITHNRVFVYQNLFSDHSFKVLTLSGNSATLTATLPTATVPAPMVGVDCEYDPVTDYIYFLTSDNAAGTTATANDALYKIHPDGTGQTTIKASVIPSPQYQFALDAGNNRAFLIDNSSAEKAIYSVNLTDGTTTKVKTVFSSATTSLTTGVWVAARAILTTTAASSISSGTVTLGGNITRSDASVTERGVVYSSSNTTPTTADSKVSSGSGNGSFTVNASGLSPVTTYYVRAYAISTAGTSYGSVQTFTTLSNDASLSALSTSSGSLSPVFTSGTVAYSVAVTNATTSITVTPTRTNANATIKVNGNAVASGTASGSINLSVGDNIITVVGLAQDGTTTKTYTLTVNRAKFPQVITFAGLPSKNYGDADFAPGATVNSSLTISYSSDNTSVATIVGGQIHIVSAGTANITASQPGDATNQAATNVTQALTVSKAGVTVTANAVSKTYGDVDPSFTYGITSGALAAGDTFSGVLSRAAGSDVGNYAITQGSLALSSNYTLTLVSANLTINKRPITIKPQPASKVYGDSDPVAYPYNFTAGSLASGDGMTGSFTRDAGNTPGTYALALGDKHPVNSTTGTDVSNNYTISFVPEYLTINKRAITLKPQPATKVYGDADPAFPYQFVSGSVAPGEGMTGSFGRDAGEDVGTYALTLGTKGPVNSSTGTSTAAYYTISFVSDNLTITKKAINVTANVQSKVYGDADPAFTYTADALSFSDTFAGTLTRAAGESAGSYAISQGTLALNANNYTFNFTGSTFTITKKAIVVAANAASKAYGDADPAFTYTADALIGGDSFSGSLSRDAGETPGDYAIIQGSLALSNNYTISYTGANLTISKRALTINADLVNKQYGDADPALTYTVIGSLVNGDAFSGSLTRQAGESTGSYAIQKGSLTAGAYYDITFNTNDLVIGKRSVVVNITPASKFYGDPDPVFAYTINTGSLLPGDHFTGAFTRVAGETGAQNYGITQGTFAIDNPDYSLSVTPSTLTINQAPLTVTVDNKTKKQGEANPVFTFSYSGFKNGEGPADLVSQPQATTTAGTNSPAGDYPVYAGYVASPNYTATYVDGVLTILPVSNDASLSNLTLAGLSLSPTFDSATTSYEADAGNATSVSITPTAHEAHATITINGDAVTSGASKTYSLYGGSNYFQVNVTAEDGTTVTGYQLSVNKTRAVDANLTAISVGGTPIAGFDPNVTTYALSVPNATSSVVISSVLSDPNGFATILVNNVPLEGGALTPANLVEGDNVIKVRVRAEDPSVTKTYTINIHRAESTNVTDLTSLVINPNSTLVKGTSTGTNINYTTSVDFNASSITVIPTAKDAMSVININNTVVASGVASVPIILNSIGTTTVVVSVTARDGVTKKTYTIVVSKNGSNDVYTTLKTNTNAVLIAGATTGNQQAYITSVPADVTSITLTPVTRNADASVKVNGTVVVSGTASAPITLGAGETIITTEVTAQDGVTKKVYVLKVSRNGSNNAFISANKFNVPVIYTNVGQTGSVNNYNAIVGSNVNSITMQVTTQDPNATLYINGVLTTRGAVSEPINLFEDRPTPVNVYVLAQDGVTERQYNYFVIRKDSAIATLSRIALTPSATLVIGTAVPNQTTYNASVAPNINSVTITATPQVSGTSISINGSVVTNGAASAPIALNVSGSTPITIVSTASDGITQKTYVIIVSKNGSSNSNVAFTMDPNSTLTAGVIAANQSNLVTSVSPTINSVRITPNPQDVNAVVKINGVVVADGVPSPPITLNAGITNITANVIAADGVTTKTYVIAVSRNGSNNAFISANKFNVPVIYTNVGQTGSVNNYNAIVGSNVNSITMQVTTQDPNATLYINGVLTTRGAVSEPINLFEDRPTPVNVYVLAQDGVTERQYNYFVIRKDSAIATLSRIALTPSATLVIGTAVPNQTTYNASVAPNINSVTITATPQVSGTSISINGSVVTNGAASAPIALNVSGSTPITIVSTASDGVTQKTYVIIVSKNGSTNANLLKLLVDKGTLSPTFSGSTITYGVVVGNEVSAIKLTPTASDAGASITVQGGAVVSGSQSNGINLIEGDNIIPVVVTSGNGTVKTYTVTVTRATAPELLSFHTKAVINNSLGSQELVVHSAVSPNGDGMNDVLTIDGITSYPENKISIINSTGVEINQIKNYDNSVNVFDGRSRNGTLQKPGTYFYVLEYLDGKETKRKTGYIILKY